MKGQVNWKEKMHHQKQEEEKKFREQKAKKLAQGMR